MNDVGTKGTTKFLSALSLMGLSVELFRPDCLSTVARNITPYSDGFGIAQSYLKKKRLIGRLKVAYQLTSRQCKSSYSYLAKIVDLKLSKSFLLKDLYYNTKNRAPPETHRSTCKRCPGEQYFLFFGSQTRRHIGRDSLFRASLPVRCRFHLEQEFWTTWPTS